jgi:hypothetical protein
MRELAGALQQPGIPTRWLSGSLYRALTTHALDLDTFPLAGMTKEQCQRFDKHFCELVSAWPSRAMSA